MNYLIFINLKTKLIVVFFAILVWFFVKTEENYHYSLNIPLRVTNLEPNKIIENKLPQEVKVNVWGKGKDLVSFMIRKDIFYNLDVSKIQGSASIALTTNEIKLLRENDLDILTIVEPELLEVKLAELTTKRLPIIPDVDVHTMPGYTVVDNIQLIPDSVTIQGLQSEIDSLYVIQTGKKNFKNVKRDIEKTIELLVPKRKHLRSLIKEVRIVVDVQKLMEKPLVEIPVAVKNKPSDLKVAVIPSTLSLVLEGGTDLLLNVTKNDVYAYLDYQKIQHSKEKSHLAYIETPKGVRYRDVKPKRFSVVVEKIR
ncbi:MAG TPA: hypothetical protein VGD14_04320 [bacterium]